MSILSSVTNNTSPTPPPRQWTNDSFVSFWNHRSFQQGELGEKAANIRAVAYRALGGIAASIAATILVFGACGIVIAGHSAVIPICVLAAVFSYWRANNIDSHMEQNKFEELRRETKNLPLPEIAKLYTWNEIFSMGFLTPDEFADAYRTHMKSLPLLKICRYYEKTVQRLENCPKPKHMYSIPHPSEFRDKWRTETQNRTFEEILKLYPLEKLHAYQIISNEEWRNLQELRSLYQQADNQRQAAIKSLDEDCFPEVFSSEKTFQDGLKKWDAEYEEHPVVQRLKTIDSAYLDLECQIRNRCQQQKEEAYLPCEAFLKERNLSYQKLKTEDRLQFDALYQAYACSAEQFEKVAEKELVQLNERHRVEKHQVSAQASLVLKAHNAKKSQAMQAHSKEESTHPRRESLLHPVEKRCKGIVDDLNAQYDARRKASRL